MIRIKYSRLFKHPLDQYQNYTIGYEIDVEGESTEAAFEIAREQVAKQAAITEQDILDQFDNGRNITQHYKEKYGND